MPITGAENCTCRVPLVLYAIFCKLSAWRLRDGFLLEVLLLLWAC